MTANEYVKSRFGRYMDECTNEEIYTALLEYVKEQAKGKESNQGKKKLYYISAEFLIGKLLSNNLINLGLYEEVSQELEKCGKSLAEIEEIGCMLFGFDCNARLKRGRRGLKLSSWIIPSGI